MQNYDEKVDAAVHAAFEAVGLWVGNHIDLAFRLNDFITQEFRFTVTGDDEDESGDDATSPDALPDAGGQRDD